MSGEAAVRSHHMEGSLPPFPAVLPRPPSADAHLKRIGTLDAAFMGDAWKKVYSPFVKAESRDQNIYSRWLDWVLDRCKELSESGNAYESLAAKRFVQLFIKLLQ